MHRDFPQHSSLVDNFYPLTLTRPAGELLFGMRPLHEKWSSTVSSLILTNVGLSEKHIHPFSWGDGDSHVYNYEDLIIEINRWMKVKGKSLDKETEAKIPTVYLNIHSR